MKKVITAALLTTTLLSANPASAEEMVLQADSLQMRQQADLFLSRFGTAPQQAQRIAIEQAMAGDGAALAKIRESRRPNVDLSDAEIGIQYIDRHLLFQPTDVEKSEGKPLLVYFHGGGWAFGSPESAARFCRELSAASGCIVFDAYYPLAPECGERELADYIRSVYAEAAVIAQDYGCSGIAVAGDSAGGYMALLLALLEEEEGGAVPEKVVAIYPVVESAPAVEDESWQQYGSGYANDAALMQTFYAAWQNNDEPLPPRLSEMPEKLLRKMPATMIIAAERDVLRDQAFDLAQKLDLFDVPVEYVLFPGAVHLFISVAGQDAAFRRAVELTSDFLTAPIISKR